MRNEAAAPIVYCDVCSAAIDADSVYYTTEDGRILCWLHAPGEIVHVYKAVEYDWVCPRCSKPNRSVPQREIQCAECKSWFYIGTIKGEA